MKLVYSLAVPDYAAGATESQIDAAYINFLSTYAATAWYHNAVPNRPAELQPFLREAEAFARDVYAPVLYKGSRATPEERRKVLAGLVRYRHQRRLLEARQPARRRGPLPARADARRRPGGGPARWNTWSTTLT